jgi:hypothetical protein
MKILAIGDIHHHIKAAEEIASKYENTHKIIFVGDYFDDFNDNPSVACKTSFWLKESLSKPNRIHLYGNHDLNYTPFCEHIVIDRMIKMYSCSGYEKKKDTVIKTILKNEDWKKLKLHHFENGFHFTHAGIARQLFEHPIKGVTNESILESIENLNIKFYNREMTDLIGGAGYCRGGHIPVGGITWNDHNQEADPINGIKQIYGHTPINDIDVLEDNSGVNICIDCGLSEILEIDEDGSYNVIKTGFDSFYDRYNNNNNKWE